MKKSVMILGCWLLTSGCAGLNVEREIVTDRRQLAGTYNLIQVGGTFGNDAERVVILDIEGDAYSFRPVTGPGRVKNFTGLKVAAALRKAEEFFSDHCAYRDYQIRTLTLPGQGLLGYELTPNYPVVLCEYGNEVSISYGKGAEGEIKVYTRLLLEIDGQDGKNPGLVNIRQ
jgi:hypothetical protein